jgi:O-antigen/teichoic acid export membrane protein
MRSFKSVSEIVKYSSLIFIANFAGALILFASNLVISQRFDPETFGNLKTILSLALFLPMLIEFGAGVTIVKYTAEFVNSKKKLNHLINWILKLRTVLFLVLLALMFIFRNQISTYLLKDASLSYLVIPGILIAGLFFFEIFKSVALGLKAYKDYSVSKFLTYASSGILMLLFGYFFGYFYPMPVTNKA